MSSGRNETRTLKVGVSRRKTGGFYVEVVEQSHRGQGFGKASAAYEHTDKSRYTASNGYEIVSGMGPKFKLENELSGLLRPVLYVRGADKSKDGVRVLVQRLVDLVGVCTAVIEYNQDDIAWVGRGMDASEWVIDFDSLAELTGVKVKRHGG